MRALSWTAAVAIGLALALPAAASAGGFATLGLSSLPDGTAPGRPWHVTLTILQHGRTPMRDLRPTVRIRRADGAGRVRTFAARATARPGVYTVSVVFPAAGTWRYAIDDGFTQRHTFAPVAIGASRVVPAPRAAAGAVPPVSAPAPAPLDDGGAGAGTALAAAAAAGLLAGLVTALALRRRRAGPATIPAR
jgi:hypothetical protein